MKKNDLLSALSVVLALYLIGAFTHAALLSLPEKAPITVWGVYTYFMLFALVIIASVELLFANFQDKIGYLFLTGMFLKLGLFMLIFLRNGYLERESTMQEKLILLLPLFLFLILEVLFVARKLTKS